MNGGVRAPRGAADRLFLEGLALDRQGRTAAAVVRYRQALEHDPRHADSLHLLGICEAQAGDAAAAIALIRQAITVNPGFADYHYNLARVLQMAGRGDQAAAAYAEVLRLDPAHVDALINLSSLMLARPDPQAAADYAMRAIARDPKSIAAHNNLGLALNALNRGDEAEALLRRAHTWAPQQSGTLVNLARVYKRQERYAEAIACLERARALRPDQPEVLNNLGSMLRFVGRLDEAIACLRRSLAIAPSATVHSNLLFNLNYHPDCPPEEVYAEHLAWARRYAEPLLETGGGVAADGDVERRLRVGYVSADLREHPVATFLRPLFEYRDPAACEVYVYADVADPDATTAWFRERSAVWRDILGRSDAEVAERIRADRIDILVDLAGHTAGNRLLVFARRVAPVQVSFLGYLGSTGMRAMDCRLTDAAMDPPGVSEAYHSERLLRLPRSMWCYAPPAGAPPPRPGPAARGGPFTFASFNNSAKVGAAVVDVWARILHALPEARLLMMTKGDGRVHEHFRAEFGRRGIAPERLDLRRRVPVAEYFSLHGDADIALDSFPYTGGTTTCNALWMGVPVLTLAGGRPFSRSAASILGAVGLADWIAASADDYVRLALDKAHDVAALGELRAGLRPRLAASPLCDGVGFARAMEAAYRTMWRRAAGAVAD